MTTIITPQMWIDYFGASIPFTINARQELLAITLLNATFPALPKYEVLPNGEDRQLTYQYMLMEQLNYMQNSNLFENYSADSSNFSIGDLTMGNDGGSGGNGENALNQIDNIDSNAYNYADKYAWVYQGVDDYFKRGDFLS